MSSIIQSIDQAIDALRHNDIVAIPTETVYGLAGNAENSAAIAKIYALKNRPLNHPLIMHVTKHWDLTRWTESIPDYACQLMEKFWPGPLTLVFNAAAGKVNPAITGGQTTIAIRSPCHPVALAVLEALDFPLVAPSANPFGKISPTTAQHVQQSFLKDELLILEGGRCTVGIESTIIDASNEQGYQILRHGAIDEQDIIAAIGFSPLRQDNTLRVPGRLASHYQPEKPLYCFADSMQLQQFLSDHKDTYVLSFNKEKHFADYAGYQLPRSAEQFAFELYYQLRLADQSDAQLIAIELPLNEGVWQGVYERLIKAGQIFNYFISP